MQYIKNTFSWLMMMVLKMMKSMRARQIFFLQNDENENDLAKSQAILIKIKIQKPKHKEYILNIQMQMKIRNDLNENDLAKSQTI